MSSATLKPPRALYTARKAKNLRVVELPGDGKPHPRRRMTEAEFIEWLDDKTRAEWLDGEVIVMDAENIGHSDCKLSVAGSMAFLAEETSAGKVQSEGMLIRLPTQRRQRMPDVFFVSSERAGILKDTVCEGAPDMIVEIVSPDSTTRDLRDKFDEYEKAGVREYWIINLLDKTISGFELIRTRKYKAIPQSNGKHASRVLKGFFLRDEWMTRPKFPSLREMMRELKLVK